MEWVVVDQLKAYLDTYNLMEPNQSVYRTNHSIETTLLKVKSDILHALDKQEIFCLVLLNLSVAFDTIGHTILLNRLKDHTILLNRLKTVQHHCYSTGVDQIIPHQKKPMHHHQ